MASIGKIGIMAQNVGMIFKHNNRTPSDGIEHSNEQIDIERTKFNYYYKKGTPKDVAKRLDEMFVLKRNNTVVLREAVVTLPKDVKTDDERKFFQAVYDFFCDDFGEENIMNAVVHKDEVTPHIHVDIIPVIKDNKEMKSTQGVLLDRWKKQHGIENDEPYERLCSKEAVSYPYLVKMHKRLSDYVKERLGYQVEILNGATEGGNKTVQQLKAAEYEAKANELKKEITGLQLDLNKLNGIMKNTGIRKEDLAVLPLLEKISYQEDKIKVLQQIIMENNCSYTKDQLEKMKKPLAIDGSRSGVVNVFDSNLTKMKIDDTAIVILELFDKIERPLPQQKFIDNNSDANAQYIFATRIKEKIVVRASRANDRKYVFVRTDNPRQTIDMLIELSRILSEELKNGKRKIYMERMEYDEFDFAKCVLEKLNTDVYYCTRLALEEKKAEETVKEEVKQIM